MKNVVPILLLVFAFLVGWRPPGDGLYSERYERFAHVQVEGKWLLCWSKRKPTNIESTLWNADQNPDRIIPYNHIIDIKKVD